MEEMNVIVSWWSELKKNAAWDIVVGGRLNTKKVMVARWAMEAETVGE